MRRSAAVAAITAAVVLWAPATSYASPPGHPSVKPRPASEHVPASVHKAQVSYRQAPTTPTTKHRTVHGAKAHALVHSYNHLKREPKNYLICDIAGGPIETIVFKTANHVWTVQQSPCSEVHVSRDDKPLPTLLSSPKWSKAIAAALGPAKSRASTESPDGARHDRAVAQAEAMIAAAPVVDGSTSVETAPDKHLDGPAQYPAIDGLVKLGAWWTVDEGSQQAFADLTSTTPDGFKQAGSGTAGKIGKPPYLTYNTYDSLVLPDGIYYEELLLEVSPLSKTQTGIAVYANVVADKKRPADEIVPSDTTSVTLTRHHHSGGHQPTTHDLHGKFAAKVVADFNNLKVDPGTTSSCPPNLPVFTATFVAEGHTWVAKTFCFGLLVRRDGVKQPYLVSSPAFGHDLSRAFRKHH